MAKPRVLTPERHRQLAERHLSLLQRKERPIMKRLAIEFRIHRETARAYLNRPLRA